MPTRQNTEPAASVPASATLPSATPYRSNLVLSARLLSVAVAALGAINLWSALLANGPGRLKLLRDVVHLPLILEHGSRTLTALFGIGLLMLARSLARQKREAWRIACVIIMVSPILHLFKGLDYEEALVCVALFALLVRYRRAFWQANDAPSGRQGVLAALSVLMLAVIYGVLGFYLLAREFEPVVTFARASYQAVELLCFQLPDALTPITKRAIWFEYSLPSISAFAIGYSAYMLLRPVLPRETVDDVQRLRARAVLSRWGGAPLAYFTLLTDKRYLFEPADDPAWIVAYRVVNRFAIALGDPIGDPARIPAAITAFVEHCRVHDWQPVFYQVSVRYTRDYREARLKALKIGQDALIDLPCFTLKGKPFQDLRTAINKMSRSGIVFQEFVSGEKDDIDTLAQMADITEEWLGAHDGEERSFAMGEYDPDSELFRDSRTFYARETASGRIVGFVSFVPIFASPSAGPDDRGWGLDLMRRRGNAPNGTMEFLIAQAALAFQSEGASVMSLGLSPLADEEEEDDVQDPEFFARARALAFTRLNAFYNFAGLYSFKRKFGVYWEPRYLIYPTHLLLPRTMYAVFEAHAPHRILAMIRSAWRRSSRPVTPEAPPISDPSPLPTSVHRDGNPV